MYVTVKCVINGDEINTTCCLNGSAYDDTDVQTSECGLFSFVKRSGKPTFVSWLDGEGTGIIEVCEGVPLERFGTTLGRIRALLHNMSLKPLRSRDLENTEVLANVVAGQWKNLYPAYPTLKSDIVFCLGEAWWMRRVHQHNVEMFNRLTQTIRNQVMARCNQDGVRWDELMRGRVWYRKLYSKVCFWDPGYDAERAAWTSAWRSLPERRPVAVPCSKLYLKKFYASQQEGFEDMFQDLYDDLDIKFDSDQPEQDEYVQVYGTTTRATMTFPASHEANMAQAFVKRYGFPREVDPEHVQDVVREARGLLEHFNTHDMVEFDDDVVRRHFTETYGARKAHRYMKKRSQELLPKHFTKRQCFPKPEPYLGKRPDNTKCRVIISYDEVLTAHGWEYFHQVNQWAKKTFCHDSNIWYTSGASPAKLGTFADRMNTYGVILEMDMSNWDGSQLAPLLDGIEKWFLTEKFSGWPDKLKPMFDNWTGAVARTARRGLEVAITHGRQSGCWATSSGNSILNIIYVMICLGLNWDSDFMMMVQGDDNVVALNRDVDVEEIVSFYARMGMKMVVKRHQSMRQVEFCSGLFWEMRQGFLWQTKPFRMFTKFGMDSAGKGSMRAHKALVGDLRGRLSSVSALPVFGPWVRHLLDDAARKRIVGKPFKKRHTGAILGGYAYAPDDLIVAQFCEHYGFEEEELGRVLAELMHVTIEDFPLKLGGIFFDDGVMVDLDLEEADLLDVVVADAMSEERQEEIEKLKRARLIHDSSDLTMKEAVVAAATQFAMEEIAMGAPRDHIDLHVAFSLASLEDINEGVAMHERYNAYARSRALMAANKKKLARSNKKARKKERKSEKELSAWRKALGNVMKAGGAALGNYLVGPMGGPIGEAAGHALARITGMGDYTIRSNSLMTENVTFGDGSIRLRHREYIGLLGSSVAFATTRYAVNPGLAETFPWLAVLAQNYERYDIRGLAFEFVSTAGYLTSTQAQGVVVMATQYDPDAQPFVNRREMEAYLYTTSGIVTEPQLHAVECDPADRPLKEMYIRYGTESEERFTDHGVLTVAVEGCPEDDVILGEIWVTYDVILENPRIMPHGYGTAAWARVSNGPADNTEVLGLIQTTPLGTLGVEITATGAGFDTINFPTLLDHGVFLVLVAWAGVALTPAVSVSASLVNCEALDSWRLDSSDSMKGPGDGSSLSAAYCVQVTDRGASLQFVSVNLPSAISTVDVVVAQMGYPFSLSAPASYLEAVEMTGIPVRHPRSRGVTPAIDFFGVPQAHQDEEKYQSETDSEDEPCGPQTHTRTTRRRRH
jgi:hypothetical protein